MQYDRYDKQKENKPISMHCALMSDDSVDVSKETCIKEEYENERQLIGKYDTMVELNNLILNRPEYSQTMKKWMLRVNL